jgi:hypothetical protein
MTFSVVVETKTRPDIDYLDMTYENLKRAGVFASKLLAEFQTVSGDHVTRQQNARNAIEAAAKIECDYVIKLEDDLDFIAEFLEATARFLTKHDKDNHAMIALASTFQTVSASHYTVGDNILYAGKSFPNCRHLIANGKESVLLPSGGFWGAQALVFPRVRAHDLVEWLGPDPYYDDGKEHHRARGHDLLLQQWLLARGHTKYLSTVPAFVQHIGRRSNLSTPNNPQPFFEFPWPGRNWTYA